MTAITSKQLPKQSSRLSRIYLRSLLLTMLGSVTIFSIADLSPSFFVIGVVGCSIGFWYARQGPSSISRIAINALLSIVIVLGLLNALRGSFSVSSFALFSLLLLILKLFDLRSPRDHGQILVLSLALLIATALTSNSMITGLGIFVMGFVFIRALMLFRLFALTPHQTAEASFSSISSTELRSVQVITGFICIVVATMIFLIMPRSLGNNAFGQWGGAPQSISTGFAEDVQLGRPGRITSSPTPVLRMTIRDRNDQPLGSQNSRAIYLRGSVLTQYESGRWVAHHNQSIPTTFRTRIVRRNQSVPIVQDATRAQWTHEYAITFDRDDQNYGYLFTPWKPLELKTIANQSRVGIDPATRMILLSSTPVQSYRIRTVNPELQHYSIPSDYVRTQISQDGISPPIASLAQQILTNAGIDPNPESRPPTQDAQAVRALETHLRTQYEYSLLSEPVPQGKDATEWFLFERQRGHCEYYASALTLMTRSVGIPSRVITGYVAAEFNDVNDSFIVRESNAHAWVEAMVAPNFWRTFDGTPQEDFHEIHEPEPSIFRTVSKFYEAIEHAWVSAIIGYDTESRNAVFGDLDPNLGLESAANTLQERIATGRTQLLRQALIFAGTVFVITLSIGLVFVFMTRAKSLQSLRSRLRLFLLLNTPSRPSKRAEHIAKQLNTLIHTKLNAIGSPCPQGLPLRTHLDSIPDSDHSELAQSIRSATATLYQFHFANNNHRSEISQSQPLIASLQAAIDMLR
jgi:protein-glutamine gamma-glutamyltransferase